MGEPGGAVCDPGYLTLCGWAEQGDAGSGARSVSTAAQRKVGTNKPAKAGSKAPAHDGEAFSSRWPLLVMRVEHGWEDTGVAYVQVARRAPTGYVVAGFLIDLMGLGLKGGYGHARLSERGYTELIMGSQAHWDDCSLEMAQELVYGGQAWAGRWKFRVPRSATQHLGILPVPKVEPSLERFGGPGGRPLLVGDFDDVADVLLDPNDADADPGPAPHPSD